MSFHHVKEHTTIPGLFREPLGELSCGRGSRPKTHQFEAVKIARFAAVHPHRIEIKAGISGRGPSDDCVSFTDVRLNLFPAHYASTARVAADVDTGPYLQKQNCQPAAQARRRVLGRGGRDRGSVEPSPSRPPYQHQTAAISL